MTSPQYYIPSTTDYDTYYTDSPDASQQHSNLTNKILLSSIIILFFVILFITSLHIYGKWVWRSYYRNSNRTHFLNQNQPISAARTAGLSKDAIAQLPTFTYTAPTSSDLEAGENMGLLECAVCLSEFQDDEQGRLLPSCKHSFHIECIDMWFYSHSTCPLCRSTVVMSTSPLIPITFSTLEQQGGAQELALQEAQNTIETTSSPHESNPSNATAFRAGDNAANVIQIPTNVLFCSDSIQSIPSQLEPSQSSEKPSQSSSSSSSSSSSRSLRCVTSITIEIPTRLDISLTSPGCISLTGRKSRCASPQEPAFSSLKSLKSPGLRESVKRILSIQSSQEKKAYTNMESPR